MMLERGQYAPFAITTKGKVMDDYDPGFHQGRTREHVESMYKTGGMSFELLLAAIIVIAIGIAAQSLFG